jgi:hypothetical protein
MKYLACFLFIIDLSCHAIGQAYNDGIVEYRKQYIAGLLSEPRHPVQPSQARNIDFFAPDQKYCVVADFKETPGSVPFMVPTHSGKQKPFKEFGTLTFKIHDSVFVLHAYQLVSLVSNGPQDKDELFVPFKDMTNYETTYGGGRYIDLSLKDIKEGKITLDFNKCYNPYCAYSDGFSCPIPPSENYLSTEIRAGEKVFVH